MGLFLSEQQTIKIAHLTIIERDEISDFVFEVSAHLALLSFENRGLWDAPEEELPAAAADEAGDNLGAGGIGGILEACICLFLSRRRGSSLDWAEDITATASGGTAEALS